MATDHSAMATAHNVQAPTADQPGLKTAAAAAEPAKTAIARPGSNLFHAPKKTTQRKAR
jgi:hypothetical protein